jgi:hypothetical protein
VQVEALSYASINRPLFFRKVHMDSPEGMEELLNLLHARWIGHRTYLRAALEWRAAECGEQAGAAAEPAQAAAM